MASLVEDVVEVEGESLADGDAVVLVGVEEVELEGVEVTLLLLRVDDELLRVLGLLWVAEVPCCSLVDTALCVSKSNANTGARATDAARSIA